LRSKADTVAKTISSARKWLGRGHDASVALFASVAICRAEFKESNIGTYASPDD
jgi:hypothetical protein